MIQKLSLLIIALSIFTTTNGQTNQENTGPAWINSMQNPNANFYETQRLFYDYWSDKTPGKGDGYKPFKRWEWFYELEVDNEGNLPAYNQLQQKVKQFKANQAAQDNSNGIDSLWTIIGPVQKPVASSGQPNGMGRVNAIGIHPTNDSIIFAGAPNGGIWRTYDLGATWTSNTDTLETMQISSIVFNPLNPQIIYAGTGDRDVTSRTHRGVIKSVDGGESWKIVNQGMGNRVVGKMIIDPLHPDTLLAATSGGIYKTTNGGLNWVKKGSSSGFKDIESAPGDFSKLYATAGGRMYYSHDNGETWNSSTGYINGSRGAIAVSADKPNYVYFIQTSNRVFTGFFRSTDYGVTFSTMSTTPNIMDYDINGNGNGGQAWYNLDIAANPLNAEEVFVGGINIFKSTDGGRTWRNSAHWLGAVHADQHVFEYTHDGKKMVVGNDGGVYYTPNSGGSWINISSGMPISEVYKLGQNKNNENQVICGYQDNGTAIYRGNNSWTTEIGGDGMECAFDPLSPNYVYGELYYGAIRRSTNGGQSFRSITNSIQEQGAWVSPFALAEDDPRIMFAGYVNVYRTSNVRSSNVQWQNITPSIPAGTNTTFRVIEHSPADPNVLYIVRSDSRFYRSDNCKSSNPTWVDITSQQPQGGWASDVEAHPYDPNTVYITKGTQVFVSTDKGMTWTNITGNLPPTSKRTIVYDEYSKGGLYVGGTPGVFYIDSSLTNWIDYSQSLPGDVSVTELEIAYNSSNPLSSKLRASTYGRGLWSAPLFDMGNRFAQVNLQGDSGSFCMGDTITLIASNSKNVSQYEWSIQPNTIQLVQGSTLSSSELRFVPLSQGYYHVDLAVSSFFNRDSVSKRNYLFVDNPTQNNCITSTNATSSSGSGIFKLGIDNNTAFYSGFDGVNSNTNSSCEQVFFFQPDSTYNIDIETGSSAQEFVRVYMDLNGNGNLSDPGELVFNGPLSNKHQFNFIAPTSPLLNQKLLMRIISDVSSISGPCASLSAGESRDFAVVFEEPIVQLGVSSSLVCPNEIVTANYTHQGKIASVLWDFGPGAEPRFSKRFDEASAQYKWGGEKIIKLIVNEDYIFYDTLNVRFSPYANLLIDTLNSNLCEGGEATLLLMDSSGAPNAHYQWFQNGKSFSPAIDTLFTQQLFNRFITMEFFTVVSDSFCVDTSAIITLNAKEKPVPSIALFQSLQCLGSNSFPFEDKTTMSVDYQRFWSFGDGNTSTKAVNNHVYTDTGSYNVSLRIEAENGCIDSVSTRLRVAPSPVSKFSTLVLKETTVSFIPQDTSWNNYTWSFGDGNTSNVKSPTHTYSKGGNYSPGLEVKSEDNCASSNVESIELESSVGFDLKKSKNPVAIYPNPSSGKFTVRFETSGSYTVTIFNAFGAEIEHSEAFIESPESIGFEIYSPGVYLVRIQSERFNTLRQVVIE